MARLQAALLSILLLLATLASCQGQEISVKNNSLYNPAIIAVIAVFGGLLLLFLIVLLVYCCVYCAQVQKEEHRVLVSEAQSSTKRKENPYDESQGQNRNQSHGAISIRHVTQGADNKAYRSDSTQTGTILPPPDSTLEDDDNRDSDRATYAFPFSIAEELETHETEVNTEQITVEVAETQNKGQVVTEKHHEVEKEKPKKLRGTYIEMDNFEVQMNVSEVVQRPRETPMTTFMKNPEKTSHKRFSSIYESDENELTIVDSDFEEYDVVDECDADSHKGISQTISISRKSSKSSKSSRHDEVDFVKEDEGSERSYRSEKSDGEKPLSIKSTGESGRSSRSLKSQEADDEFEQSAEPPDRQVSKSDFSMFLHRKESYFPIEGQVVGDVDAVGMQLTQEDLVTADFSEFLNTQPPVVSTETTVQGAWEHLSNNKMPKVYTTNEGVEQDLTAAF